MKSQHDGMQLPPFLFLSCSYCSFPLRSVQTAPIPAAAVPGCVGLLRSPAKPGPMLGGAGRADSELCVQERGRKGNGGASGGL